MIEEEDIAQAFKIHFLNIYSIAEPGDSQSANCIGGIKTRVAEEMNNQLLAPFSLIEVDDTFKTNGAF